MSLRDDEDPVAAGVTVHDETAPPSYAFALASLQRPAFPLPLGVLRAVEKPRYEEMLAAQVEDARSKRKADLQGLLLSGDTWTVAG